MEDLELTMNEERQIEEEDNSAHAHAHERVAAVRLQGGARIRAGAVVLTTGTFLGGQIHIGDLSYAAGRFGDAAAHALSRTLARVGFVLGRLKTGTPPRLDARTIDFTQLEPQPGDTPPLPFSYLNDRIALVSVRTR